MDLTEDTGNLRVTEVSEELRQERQKTEDKVVTEDLRWRSRKTRECCRYGPYGGYRIQIQIKSNSRFRRTKMKETKKQRSGRFECYRRYEILRGNTSRRQKKTWIEKV